MRVIRRWLWSIVVSQLSLASKRTLEFQGGRMTQSEAMAFEQDELFELSIQMRKWDEMAKEENIPVPDLEIYKQMPIQENLLQEAKQL